MYVCKNCGSILYTISRNGSENSGILTPYDLKYRSLRSKCPICGREITVENIDPINNIMIMRKGEADKIFKRR
ncbi:MAG: hypothetical protein ABWJ42_06775 [Sulfolobales archaeon]